MNTLTEIDKLIKEAKERKASHKHFSERKDIYATGALDECDYWLSQLTQLKTGIQGSYSEEEVKLTRIEVIDKNGRAYVHWDNQSKVELSFQDEGRTLKIFVADKK